MSWSTPYILFLLNSFNSQFLGGCLRQNKYRLLLAVFLVGRIVLQPSLVSTQAIPSLVLPDETYSQDIYDLAQSTTVRISQDRASGTGVIIYQENGIYSVLTNWHVVETDRQLQLVTADGQAHVPIAPPQQLGSFDLAIVQFESSNNYAIATIAAEIPQVGEKIYAAGFPLYKQESTTDTIALGIEAFRLTQGEISLVPSQSLPEGYRLGYSNDTEIGMSGGPIFNAKGFLIGIHGRGKYRDPGFGVYTFADGSEPNPQMLEKMVNSSWGIPIDTYLQFTEN